MNIFEIIFKMKCANIKYCYLKNKIFLSIFSEICKNMAK